MTQVSYSDVFDIRHERDYEEEIRVHDIVRTGPNLFPHYEVIAVHADKVWVRNLQTGVDGITPLERCRKVNGQPAP